MCKFHLFLASVSVLLSTTLKHDLHIIGYKYYILGNFSWRFQYKHLSARWVLRGGVMAWKVRHAGSHQFLCICINYCLMVFYKLRAKKNILTSLNPSSFMLWWATLVHLNCYGIADIGCTLWEFEFHMCQNPNCFTWVDYVRRAYEKFCHPSSEWWMDLCGKGVLRSFTTLL